MRALIVCPTHKLYRESLESIMQIRPPTGGTHDVVFLRDQRPLDADDTGGHRRVAEKYNAARQAMLAGGYDVMLTVEDDMLVPRDVVDRLLEANADIAYGLYVLRHQIPYEWNASDLFTDSMRRNAWTSNVQRASAALGTITDCDGLGLGCTLIRRQVMEHVAFRTAQGPHELHASGEPSHCDWYLATDAMRLGFTSRLHGGVLCGHISNWPAPRVLWPDVIADNPVRFCRWEGR